MASQLRPMTATLALFLLSLIGSSWRADAVQIIRNGLAPPEIVHTPVFSKPRCTVSAPPLDLAFVLDSSGSLKNKFQDEVDVIRRIVRHVTIGPTATRVLLVQFSGVQHLEFDFNAFDEREDLLAALDLLRHVSGITRVGGAFEYAQTVMKPEFGMRGSNVKKVLFLLSDGRTHDYPLDAIASRALRNAVPNLDIWAYGTGEYVAMAELLNITLDPTKIVTNKNLSLIEPLFNPYHGVEICTKVPSCIKGSDKPLDLFLVIDSSESIETVFYEQVKFVVERVIQNINIHPDAVRLTLITYSGKVFVHFMFNDPQFGNNTAVIRHLNALTPIKGTTSTHLALQAVYELMMQEPSADWQARKTAQKLVLLVTDGRSSRSPHLIATRIRAENVPIIAVSLHRPTMIDESELESITGDISRVFTPRSPQGDFERAFSTFVGFSCSNMELGPAAKPRVRGSTDISCTPNSLTLTVRTQRPMNGLMYAHGFPLDSRCVLVADGRSRELTITFIDGTCGVIKTAAVNGYNFNATVVLQFHPLIVTRADQGIDISCFSEQPVELDHLTRGIIKPLADVSCDYRLHRFSSSGCVALDAKVGESIWHKWQCDVDQHTFLVHDCYAESEHSRMQIIDSDGCEIDPLFLETPNYSRLLFNSTTPFVYQMSVFKWPADATIIFECSISLCPLGESCQSQIPPRCASNAKHLKSDSDATILKRHRSKRANAAATKSGFARTLSVTTRTLNVLESEAIKPMQQIKYCDVRL